MRPIVKTSFQKLSTFLASILSDSIETQDTHLGNSFDVFFYFINGVSIPDGYDLISLEVICQYTKISVEFALECVETFH